MFNIFLESAQTPPFMHGLDVHSSMSLSQFPRQNSRPHVLAQKSAIVLPDWPKELKSNLHPTCESAAAAAQVTAELNFLAKKEDMLLTSA